MSNSGNISYQHDAPIGRIPILGISPSIDGGRWPAKAFAGEVIPFSANVFREGHDSVAAEILLTDPKGKTTVIPMSPGAPGTDRWYAKAQIPGEGDYTFQVRAYGDDYETWHHAASVKIAAGIDEELMLLEGVRLFAGAASEKSRSKTSAKLLTELAEKLGDTGLPVAKRLELAEDGKLLASLAKEPIRSLETLSAPLPIKSERRLSGFGAWYEFFPRSEGAVFDAANQTWQSGNFRTAATRLEAVAKMGFDILYMPPIHPIGETFRKGPNNTLTPGPQDPGSPWAIGGAAGGHDTIHPDLGTMEDFEAFVAEAHRVGLEVALDLALQASPDHPWVKEHPEWFTTRADGTIAYAENPPKKYQDIYPINFDNDPEGIYQEVLRCVRLWISKGVKVFRVDNPHTKPVNFWEWLIGEVNATNPEVIFLAEAFTRPSMMHTLGRVGFQQSYTYFTWRNNRYELEAYFNEVAYQSSDFFRPNFWVSTPDILTEYLQFGGKAGHQIRAVLASMATPNWGLYAGYELIEAVARPGAEEHIDSEKFQYKPRDWQSAEASGRSIAPFITKLNEIRKANPALQQLRNIEIQSTDDERIICFSKHIDGAYTDDGKPSTIIVVVNLDPHSVRETAIHLDLGKLGLEYGKQFAVTDLLNDTSFTWSEHNYVRLDPFTQPAHILRVDRKKQGK